MLEKFDESILKAILGLENEGAQAPIRFDLVAQRARLSRIPMVNRIRKMDTEGYLRVIWKTYKHPGNPARHLELTDLGRDLAQHLIKTN